MNVAGWVAFLGVVITAAVSLLSARTSAKATRAAAERAAAAEALKLQLDARDSQIESWRKDTEALRVMREEDNAVCERKLAALRAEISTLKEQWK